MIDYVKIHALPVTAEKVLNNDLLTFPLSNVATTGEVLNRPQTAEYRGLKLSIRPGGEVSLRGSLHKYHEGGTNYDDFSLIDIQNVVRELTEIFEFAPEKAVINFIEIGVNIPLEQSPTELIKMLVMYHNTPFTQMRTTGEGYGKVAETQRFDAKLYDKSLQYGLEEYLLRIEGKIKRMAYLTKYGINNLTLGDLTEPKYYPAFCNILADMVNELLLFNPTIDPNQYKTKDRDLLLQGRYSDYWKSLDKCQRNRKRKHFERLSQTEKLKNELRRKIIEKCNLLTTCQPHQNKQKVQPFNHFQREGKNDKMQPFNPKVNGYFVSLCPITGLTLSHQKRGSKYLTTSGVKWHKKNEPETYQTKLEILLTDKWKKQHENDPENVWINEIAHQIRNKFYNPGNNPRNNTKTSIRNLKEKGLKLFPVWDTISVEKRKLIV